MKRETELALTISKLERTKEFPIPKRTKKNVGRISYNKCDLLPGMISFFFNIVIAGPYFQMHDKIERFDVVSE